jgi:hypothetical protein
MILNRYDVADSWSDWCPDLDTIDRVGMAFLLECSANGVAYTSTQRLARALSITESRAEQLILRLKFRGYARIAHLGDCIEDVDQSTSQFYQIYFDDICLNGGQPLTLIHVARQ